MHDVAAGQWKLELVWSVIYFSAFAVLLLYRKLLPQVLSEHKTLLLLLLWTGISVIWSADPGLSFRKFIALIGSAVVGLVLSLRFRLHEQARLLAASMAIAALISLVVSLKSPAMFPATEQAGDAWHGIFSHKNVLGRAMAFGAISALCIIKRRVSSLAAVSAFLAFAYLIFRAHSQTAMAVTLIACLLVACSLMACWKWRDLVGGGALLSLLVMSCVAIAAVHLGLIAGWFHRDLTLTGRSKIWEFAWLNVMQRPLLGYGYSGFWWVASDSRQTLSLLHYATPHAHNGFLDLSLQIGFVGTLLFAAGWIVNWIAAFRHLRAADGADRWPVIFLTCMLIYSCTENSLLVPNSLLWIVYISTAFGLSSQSRYITGGVQA